MRDIRFRVILAALLGVAVILTGTTAMAAPAKTKLVYWTMWEPNPIFTAYLEEAGREFAKTNPQFEGVEIVKVPFSGYEAKYVATFMSKKGAPDIFIGSAFEWAGTYDFADKMPEDLAKAVDSSVFEFQKSIGVFKGVRYGLPSDGGPFQTLFINTDMMQEAGLDPNRPPKDLTEFLDYAKKMTKYDAGGKVVRGGFGLRYKGHPLGITDKFLPFLHAFDATFVDLKYKNAVGVVNSKNAIEALTYYGDLVNKHKVVSLEVGNPEDAFSQKLAAMMTRESWGVPYVHTRGPDVKFKVFALPPQKATPGPWTLFPFSEMVFKNSPNKKLAWDFYRFIWTKDRELERHQKQNMAPTMVANFDAPFMKSRPDYDALKEMLKRKPGPVYDHPKCSEIGTAYGDSVLDVVYGKKNAESALNEAAVRIQRMLK